MFKDDDIINDNIYQVYVCMYVDWSKVYTCMYSIAHLKVKSATLFTADDAAMLIWLLSVNSGGTHSSEDYPDTQ